MGLMPVSVRINFDVDAWLKRRELDKRNKQNMKVVEACIHKYILYKNSLLSLCGKCQVRVSTLMLWECYNIPELCEQYIYVNDDPRIQVKGGLFTSHPMTRAFKEHIYSQLGMRVSWRANLRRWMPWGKSVV